MRQRLLAGPQRQKGFTLIELLIVVVVLGVLAAVVIMAVGAFDNRGELAACKADVKSVEGAVEAYRAKEGTYPDSLDELTKSPGNYLRELPNTEEGTGDYWVVYDSASGTVAGRLKNNEWCAGELAMATPGPSGTATEPGEPGGGEPGGGNPTTTTTAPGGGNPTTTTTAPGGGNPTTTTTAPGGGNPTTTTTAPGGGNPNPVPTPGQPGMPVVNCFNPPGLDFVDCTASWAAPAGPVTRYEWQYVVRTLGACPFFLSFPPLGGSGSSTTNSYTIDGLIPFVDYCFRVRAVNGNIRGPWSNPVSFVGIPSST